MSQDNITVIVRTATKKNPETFHWPETSLVGPDADEAAKKFGLTPEQPPTFQDAKGDVFDRNNSLQFYHVKNGDKLELISRGGGV